MRSSKRIQTGEIIARDYGLVLHEYGQRRVFFSPSKYAIGLAILESPSELRRRIREKSEREGIEYQSLEEAFVNGVVKREGSKNLLNIHGKKALQNARRYGTIYFANIKSKSREGPAFYDVQLGSPEIKNGSFSYHSARCECSDNFWNEVKCFDVICPHISALEIALYKDSTSRKSSKKNITQLSPRERTEHPSMPFSLFQNSSTREKDEIITDILFDYFVEEKDHFEINKGLLENRLIYSIDLLRSIQDIRDKVQYKVLRHKEKDLENGDKKYCGAVKALEKKIIAELKIKRFKSDYYAVEFKGTDYETISKRFRRGNLVYSICIREGMLPVIVKKNLFVKSKNIFQSNDPREDSPFMRIGCKYISIDDATRRESLTEIIIPGMKRESIIQVPKWMSERYRALCGK